MKSWVTMATARQREPKPDNAAHWCRALPASGPATMAARGNDRTSAVATASGDAAACVRPIAVLSPPLPRARPDARRHPLARRLRHAPGHDQRRPEGCREPDLLGGSTGRASGSNNSGSTGRRTTSYFDPEAWLMGKHLLKLRARLACGVRPWDRVALMQEEQSQRAPRGRFDGVRSFSIHRPIDEVLPGARIRALGALWLSRLSAALGAGRREQPAPATCSPPARCWTRRHGRRSKPASAPPYSMSTAAPRSRRSRGNAPGGRATTSTLTGCWRRPHAVRGIMSGGASFW